MKRRRRRRVALLELNPGRTRRIRFGKKRAYTVEIDPKTRKVLKAAGGGAIPRYWIGVPVGNVRALERALRAADRDLRDCRKVATCYEPRRDRLGRRRRCRQTFKSKMQAYDALDDALSGLLARYMDQADDGSPALRDLELRTGSGRRRRRLPTWGHAIDWLAPSSRRWKDFDPARLREVSDALEETISRTGEPFRRLRLPRETERLLEEDTERIRCDEHFGDATQRAVAAALADILEAVPF